ncbi:alpha/beta hydrolase [Leifsonia sp. NPDC058292]|uniref:alpha/beta hydrolase n=1 Tax=Leifsonia sp. NPDC058292 TaxID=3346428 RepID=UPI0036D8EFA1
MSSADAPEHLVLLLHGRGGAAGDLAWLRNAIPRHWRSLCLQAPLPLGDGFEWFRVPPDAAAGPLSANVAPAADRLMRWLDDSAPTARVGLVGYSQGGAVALHVLRRHPHRFEFVAAFAGFTTIDAEPTDAGLAARPRPVFWARGTADDVIPPGDIDRMHEFLPDHSLLEERIYPGAGHEITPRMAADLTAFIERNTPA